jgi:hypothetical protein
MNYRIKKVDIGKNTEVIGVDMGTTPILWAWNRKYVVIKLRGHSAWTARWETGYFGAYFQVLEIIDQDETYWNCKEVIEIPVRLDNKS